jgi:alkylated DNA repair protein alkB family protein 1
LSNLDAHYDIPTPGIWNLHVKSQRDLKSDDEINNDVICRKVSPKRQKTDSSYLTAERSNVNGQKAKEENQDAAKNSRDLTLTPSDLVRKLRWVTLGYQYNWTTKVYDFDNPVDFPKEAGDLSVAVAKAVEGLGYKVNEVYQWQNTYKGDDFVPEAGIVNYYQLKDTLMAHVDRSEMNMEAPLVSIR